MDRIRLQERLKKLINDADNPAGPTYTHTCTFIMICAIQVLSVYNHNCAILYNYNHAILCVTDEL